jgi:hypothetical protein
MRDFAIQDEYGPVTYNELTWAGQIKSLLMEMWPRGSQTAQAVKVMNVIVSIILFDTSESPILIYRSQNVLTGEPIIRKLSDIIGPCNEDLTVIVLAEALQKRLKIEMKKLALFRYQRA